MLGMNVTLGLPFLTLSTVSICAASLGTSALALGSAAVQQDQELGATFELPDGLEVELWAESPHFYNPTAIDVDARGRLWVTEAVNYRKWGGRNPGLDHPKGDRVVILEDVDGDGQCDRSSVFVQDEELVSPLGIAVIGSRVFVSCSPHLFVYTDENGDDRSDRREKFLTGFGGFNHDHGLHSVVEGPGGRLHFAVGNAGPHLVTDRDGWQLRSGSIYRGGGPQVADNKAGLISDDGRLWTGGLGLRVDADGTGLRVTSHNFRNNYEIALDAFGDAYQTDNDDDGNRSCRTQWCMHGGNHGFFSPDGARAWQADRRAGQATQTAHWHQDDPGVLPTSVINGAGGPTGCAVYEGELMAQHLSGAVLNCDAGARVVYAHQPRFEGAGVTLAPGFLIRPQAGQDGQSANWFRPSDVAVGTDGAVYVADWYDPGVGGHAMRDREGYGRILRIRPEDTSPQSPTFDLKTNEGRLMALHSPAVHARVLGRRALQRDGEEAQAVLSRHFESESDPRKRARALWVAAGPVIRDFGLARKALRDANPRIRATAVRVLAQSNSGRMPAEWIREWGICNDPSALVRRELCLQLVDVPLAECMDLFVALAAQYDGKDRSYLEALGLAAEGREEEIYTELAAEFGDVPARWDDRFEGLAWRLHPDASLMGFTARAMDSALPVEARHRALDAIAFMKSRPAAEAMLTLSRAASEEVASYARYWLGHRSTNDWLAFGIAERSGIAGMDQASIAWQSDVMRAGSVEIDVDVSEAAMIWLVVTDGGDGNGCDWADWIDPRFIQPEGELLLTETTWLEAESGWGEVRIGKNCGGDGLAIGEREFSNGIGTHSASHIAYAVPEGATRFQALAGPDRGGTSQQAGASTSVRFQVLLQAREAKNLHAELEALVLDAKSKIGERKTAAVKLARDGRGALRLIRLAAQGDLPGELIAPVSAAIFENPDGGVRALASQHFTRPGEEGHAFPSVSDLLELQGDAARGREVFSSDAAQCATCHGYQLGESLRGGDIGPDLTSIHEKYDRTQLFDSILNPSAGIAFGYEGWLVQTKDGEVYSGFILADGDNLVLKDTNGDRFVIAADEIESRKQQHRSTMPEGVALDLNAQELADLVAFLSIAPENEPEFGDPIELFDGESFEGWTYHLSDSNASAEQVWSIVDGTIRCNGNPSGYL
ncbi:MAG: putative membrane-bound dehydrogenase-like protein, partial [Planctomycetota bacterium]